MEQDQLRLMLQELLQEGLQKELAPITRKLDGLETRFDGLETRFEGLESRFEGLESRFDGLETRFDGLETRFDGLETRFDELENQVSLMRGQLDRIESSQTEDVVGMLHVIDEKITSRTDRHKYQISLLNDRLLVVEADVCKLQTI